MATHSTILAWEIPWTVDPGGLQSMGLLKSCYGLLTKHFPGGSEGKASVYMWETRV